MPSVDLLKTFVREIVTSERVERVPEPDLVMDDPEKVAAYTRAGREDGVAGSVYLFHASQVSEVIRPGDTVVDMGCGPATQLALIARLNPEVNFIGVDLSSEMLSRAESYLEQQGVKNVTLVEGDITSLEALPTDSADAVFSTVTLHHLPDFEALENAFRAARRVLKPDGGFYFVDFGRLKSEKSMHAFAYQHAERQAELFTLDYLYSLHAAFRKQEFKELSERYFPECALRTTFLMPYLVTIKSPPRANPHDVRLRAEFKHAYEKLPDFTKRDLNDLMSFFRMGGLKSSYL